MQERIVTKDELLNVVKKLKELNKKIVMTNGCFDILHAGHVKYLNESKKFGDILVVAVNSDSSVKRLKGQNRPVNGEFDRAYILSNLKSVDYVVIFNEDTPYELLSSVKPDIYTKGADYTLETLPEAEAVMKNGGKVEFINLVSGLSTTKIIDKIK